MQDTRNAPRRVIAVTLTAALMGGLGGYSARAQAPPARDPMRYAPQMGGDMGRMQPGAMMGPGSAALAASGDSLYVLRGNTVYLMRASTFETVMQKQLPRASGLRQGMRPLNIRQPVGPLRFDFGAPGGRPGTPAPPPGDPNAPPNSANPPSPNEGADPLPPAERTTPPLGADIPPSPPRPGNGGVRPAAAVGASRRAPRGQGTNFQANPGRMTPMPQGGGPMRMGMGMGMPMGGGAIAVSGNYVYVMSGDTLYRLRATDLTVLSQKTMAAPGMGRMNGAPPPNPNGPPPDGANRRPRDGDGNPPPPGDGANPPPPPADGADPPPPPADGGATPPPATPPNDPPRR